MSYRTLNSHPLNASVKTLLKRGAHIGLGIGAFAPMLAMANPTGGQVVAGQANITAQNANNLVIHQGTQSAIIDWQQFSIGSGQYVQFLQPSSSSVVLNRVVGGSPTSILGNLSANGQVFLVNSNGVYFAKGASIDAQGFLASTLDIKDSDFLNHNYTFGTPGATGATVVNEGSITAHKGGYVVLAGDYAQNTGIITAQSGHVILAAGSKATLNLSGNQLVNFAVNQATLASYVGVNNSGSLIADGGTVVMTADVANALKATVVNNSGLVEAKSMSAAGGHIYLTATGGNILNSGTINASAGKVGAKGGDIVLKTDGKTTLTETSQISAAGNGAKGGHLELSGGTLSVRGGVDLGHGGGMLIDPLHLQITTGSGNNQGTSAASVGYVGVGFIEGQLNGSNSVTLLATGLIDASGGVHDITATGKGTLNLNAGTGGIELGGVDINIGGAFNANMGYGTFGRIKARDVDMNATGVVTLQDATRNAKGKILNYSVQTTGAAASSSGYVVINANRIATQHGGSGDLAIKSAKQIQLNGKIGFGSTEGFNGKVTLIGSSVEDNGDLFATGDVLITASNGYASNNGHTIEAKSVTVSQTQGSLELGGVIATSGDVNLTATGGNILVGNLSATGNVNVADTSAEGGVFVGGIGANHNVTVTGKRDVRTGGIEAGDVVTVNAGGDYTVAGASSTAIGGEAGMNITADHILAYGGVTHLDIFGGAGNVTIKGIFGSNSGEGLAADLGIFAEGNIKTDHSIIANDLEIAGKSLAYTGTGDSFELAANNGSLKLEAAIGKASAPVAYSVFMSDRGGILRIRDSIFTAGSITALQSGGTGVLVGEGEGQAVTLSAGKSIGLTGSNIGIGNARGSSGEIGVVTLKAVKDISFTANHTGSGNETGNVTVRAGDGEAGNGSTVDHSVLVQAGGNLTLNGHSIQIQGGNASAFASVSNGNSTAITAVADVSLVAGKNLSIVASSGASIRGGNAAVFGHLGSHDKVSVNADASVSLSAGKLLSISAIETKLSAGYGFGSVVMGSHGTGAATVKTDVNLSGKTGIVLTGTGSAEAGVDIHGGNDAGDQALVDAFGAGAKASLNVHAGVNLVTGGDLTIVGHEHVRIQGGFDAGHSASLHAASKAKAKLTVNNGVTVSAGNIFMGSGDSSGHNDIRITGGSGALGHFDGLAAPLPEPSSGSIAVSATSRVDLTATGNISIHANHSVDVSGGYGPGQQFGHTVGSGGTLTLNADVGVGLKAGGDIDLAGGNGSGDGVFVFGGARAGASHGLEATQGATVNYGMKSRVDIAAGGALTATGRSVRFEGGFGAGSSQGGGASSQGYGATKLTETVDASVNITAGSMTVQVFGGAASLDGGFRAGASAGFRASGAAAAVSTTFDASLNLNVTGALKIMSSSSGHLKLAGGSSAGRGQNVTVGSGSSTSTFNTNELQASGGKANSTVRAGVSVKAGSVLFSNAENGSQSIYGGYGAGAGNITQASGGGSASRNIDASVSITAKNGFTMQGAHHRALIIAKGSAGASAAILTSGAGKAAVTLGNSVNVSAKNIAISADVNTEIFGGGASVGVAHSAQVAANGGTASLTVNSAVGLTAAGGIALHALTGSTSITSSVSHHHAGRVLIEGGNGATTVDVEAGHGGNAGMTINEGVNLKAGTGVTLTDDDSLGSVVVAAASGLGQGNGPSQSRVQTNLGGGIANFTGTGNVNITAGGALTIANGGVVTLAGGSREGFGMAVEATAKGTAKSNIVGDVNINTASVGITGGSVILAGGGVNDAAGATISGSHGGIAAETVESALRITDAGAFAVTAAKNVEVLAGAGSGSLGAGFMGAGAHIVAAQNAAQATLTGTTTVQIKAASVSLTAGDGHVRLEGANNDAFHGSLIAVTKGDKATETLNGAIGITATTGAITFTAHGPVIHGPFEGAIGIFAGDSSGASQHIIGSNAGAIVNANEDASITLNAKTGVTLNADDEIEVVAGNQLGSGALIVGNGKNAKTTVVEGASVSITTGGNLSLNGTQGIFMSGGFRTAASQGVIGSHSGQATATETATINLKATGNLNLTASSGSIQVRGGAGNDFSPSSSDFSLVSASRHGIATQNTAVGVSLQAGKAVNIAAAGPVFLTGGSQYSASINAQNGATASLNHDASLAIKAGTKVNVEGVAIIIAGGSNDKLTANAYVGIFGTHAGTSSDAIPSNSIAGGKVTAGLNAAVSITAGSDVNLSGGSIFAVGGSNNRLFVGATRDGGGFAGAHWNGGSANLTANTGVTVSAGHNLNISAGSLQVLGMQGGNQANVNGGTSSAVANLSLKGNASLIAVNDIKLDVDSNASIVGGALGNLRADHAIGHVTILGSADATLNAGHDVVLDNIGGSLTVAGINVNSSHAGSILADAHADAGFASVTGHADAGIAAGHDVRMGSGGIGGAINVVGGQFVSAVTLGLASSQHATATANASITAGNNLTLVGDGDLTVGGGLFNSAAITNTFSNGASASGQRTASLQTKATISAGKAASITVAGDAVIAGGDSLKAKASLSDDSFMSGTVNADASVLIKGGSVTLNVGGNLLVRGGSAATVRALGIGAALNATADAEANASIIAKSNVTINVGSSNAGTASFIGGSAGGASAWSLFSDNKAAGTIHADVNVTAGKAITLTAADINVAGGPAAENSNLVLAGALPGILAAGSVGANSGTATAIVTGKVNFTAGTNLKVTATHNINFFGGSRGGNSAFVTAAGGSSGHNDTAALTVDSSVNLKGAKVTLTADSGGGNVNATVFPNSIGSMLVSSSGFHNTATATVNGSINITGTTSLTVHGNGGTVLETPSSGGSFFSSGGLTVDTTINISAPNLAGAHPHGVAPTGFAPMTRAFGTEGLRAMPEGVRVSPAASAPAAPAVSVSGTSMQVAAPAITALDTIQSQGLVLDLVTLMGEGSQPQPELSTAFTPSDLGTAFTAALPSRCTALLAKSDVGSYRCSAGGK